MIELPEAFVLARQMNECISGKLIRHVFTGETPHKFAWFSGEPAIDTKVPNAGICKGCCI